MPSLAKRGMYLATLALIVGAIVAETVAKNHAARGMMTLARASGGRGDMEAAKATASGEVRASGVWTCVGLGLAALALGSWAASSFRGEAGPWAIPALLFASYAFWLMLLV
ncbi:hypothetical protein [Paludisphaera soli]|uniref:hypothetical protein n=1 Tax=Paludisphaera soli TaxID=2712865 RepID=UPI0013E9C8B5|nr:hypothetical protein [Paludisphaera soli]